MEAAAHPNQANRLAALHDYGILDTPREADFDDIVALASQICEAPISVVNLIDAERQWFKAEVGLGVRETPLATSICSHVILDDDFVEIPDTLSDPRMADNPLCTGEPGLRFYAGAILRTPEGLPIGTLCVLDNAPRTLTDFQRNAIRILARQVMTQLDLRLALKHQDVARREIDHRVMNSMQTISSVIRLQASRLSDKNSRKILDSVDRRIQAVAMLHQQLQLDRTGESGDLSPYMAKIAELQRSAAPRGIAVEADFAAVRVKPRSATALAMLVSEFVANSFKHAFPDGRRGHIRFSGQVSPEGAIRVVCSDDGVGHEDWTRGTIAQNGLGMTVMQASAATLDAKLEFAASDTGVRLVVDIPPGV